MGFWVRRQFIPNILFHIVIPNATQIGHQLRARWLRYHTKRRRLYQTVYSAECICHWPSCCVASSQRRLIFRSWWPCRCPQHYAGGGFGTSKSHLCTIQTQLRCTSKLVRYLEEYVIPIETWTRPIADECYSFRTSCAKLFIQGPSCSPGW